MSLYEQSKRRTNYLSAQTPNKPNLHLKAQSIHRSLKNSFSIDSQFSIISSSISTPNTTNNKLPLNYQLLNQYQSYHTSSLPSKPIDLRTHSPITTNAMINTSIDSSIISDVENIDIKRLTPRASLLMHTESNALKTLHNTAFRYQQTKDRHLLKKLKTNLKSKHKRIIHGYISLLIMLMSNELRIYVVHKLYTEYNIQQLLFIQYCSLSFLMFGLLLCQMFWKYAKIYHNSKILISDQNVKYFPQLRNKFKEYEFRDEEIHLNDEDISMYEMDEEFQSSNIILGSDTDSDTYIGDVLSEVDSEDDVLHYITNDVGKNVLIPLSETKHLNTNIPQMMSRVSFACITSPSVTKHSPIKHKLTQKSSDSLTLECVGAEYNVGIDSYDMQSIDISDTHIVHKIPVTKNRQHAVSDGFEHKNPITFLMLPKFCS